MKLCALKLAKQMYDSFNRKYFRGKLPDDVELYWSSNCPFMTRGEKRKFNAEFYGETALWETEAGKNGAEEVWTITLSDQLRRHMPFLAQTLLHEMVHIELSNSGHESAGHGLRFKRRKHRLMQQGAYDAWT